MRASFAVRFALANALAELVGLGAVGAIVGWLATAIGPDTPAFAPLVVALGALEGAVVGVAQARVLRERLPEVSTGAWTRATIAGAVLAWALGMLPSVLIDGGHADPAAAPQVPAAVELLLAAMLGAIAGPVLGGVQALVLRRHVRGGGTWVLANAIAWAAAMPIVFAAAGGMPPSGPDGQWIALALVSLLAAGYVVGAIEGVFLERILDARGEEPRGPRVVLPT